MKRWSGPVWGKWWPCNYAIVIPTNGEVTRDHRAVMGAGVAKWAADTFPDVPRTLGRLLDTNGNHCYVIPCTRQQGEWLISFPTKHTWKGRSDLVLIEQSARELVGLADTYGLAKLALPRVGCGNGGLDWERQVRPILVPLLDERFVVCHDPQYDPVPAAKAGRAVTKKGVK